MILKKKSIYSVIAALSIFLLPSMALADLYYEQTTYEEFLSGLGGQSLNKQTHQKVYIKGLMMKIDQLESDSALIIRLDKRVIWEVNNKKKEYTELPFHEVEMEQGVNDIKGQQLAPQMESGMKAAQQGMIEATSGMPEERRDFMRKMMIQQMRKMGTVQRTGKSEGKIVTKKLKKEKVINSYHCQRYKILKDSTPIIDMWVTDQVKPPRNYFDFFASMNAYKPKVVGAMKKVSGLPIKVRYVESFDPLRKVQYIKEITKLQVKAIASKLFELPKGSRKVEKASGDLF